MVQSSTDRSGFYRCRRLAIAAQAIDVAGFSGDIHRAACRAQRKKSYKDRSNEQSVMSSESESVKVSDSIEVEITGREASLILKYGYPFPDQATAFEKVAGKKGYHRVTVGEFWLEIIVGDLCRSIKEVRSLPLREELSALCDSLEIAMGNSGSSGFQLT